MSETPRPAKMTHEELVAILDDIAAGFRSGDTLEGSIEFTMSLEDDEGDLWDVMGAYRIGNLEGQGGVRLIRGPRDGS